MSNSHLASDLLQFRVGTAGGDAVARPEGRDVASLRAVRDALDTVRNRTLAGPSPHNPSRREPPPRPTLVSSELYVNIPARMFPISTAITHGDPARRSEHGRRVNGGAR